MLASALENSEDARLAGASLWQGKEERSSGNRLYFYHLEVHKIIILVSQIDALERSQATAISNLSLVTRERRLHAVPSEIRRSQEVSEEMKLLYQ